MQLYQQNWATFGSSSSSSTAFPLYAWGHNYGGKVHHEKRTNASTRKKQTLLVSSHGNNVGSCHFESRDNPEGWGSEIGYEFTQQCKTAKPGSAWGGATTFLGSWRPPTGSTGQRGPPVSVPSCSLQLGPTLCPDTACPLTVATLDPKELQSRERLSALLLLKLPKDISWTHQKVPRSEWPKNRGYQIKTVFCIPSGFL